MRFLDWHTSLRRPYIPHATQSNMWKLIKETKLVNEFPGEVERIGTTTMKGSSQSCKRLRGAGEPLATICKDKPDNSKSIDNSGRKIGPIPKRKATIRHCGDEEVDDTSSEGKEAGGMDWEKDRPLSSRVSNSFKIETNTPESKKDDAIGEQGMVMLLIRMDNPGG